MKQYLRKYHRFRTSEMLILLDDGEHHRPTKKNIEAAFQKITEYSEEGDVVFIHYSGHVRTIQHDRR